jgi:hypothetical protein
MTIRFMLLLLFQGMFVLDKHHYRPAEEEPRGNPGMKTGGAEKGSCAAIFQARIGLFRVQRVLDRLARELTWHRALVQEPGSTQPAELVRRIDACDHGGHVRIAQGVIRGLPANEPPENGGEDHEGGAGGGRDDAPQRAPARHTHRHGRLA